MVVPMTYQQKNTAAAFWGVLAGFAVYGIWGAVQLQAGHFAGPEGLALMAKGVLAMIAGTIVLTVAGSILFNITTAMRDRDNGATFVSDERDRAIEMRGKQVGEVIGGVGLCLAMAGLALGIGAFWALNIIVAGFAFGAMAGSLWQLCLYRRDV